MYCVCFGLWNVDVLRVCFRMIPLSPRPRKKHQEMIVNGTNHQTATAPAPTETEINLVKMGQNHPRCPEGRKILT